MIHSGEWEIRVLQKQDASYLVKWLSDERVLRFYEGRDRPHDLELVREHFYQEEESIARCIVTYCRQPIGYAQFYPLEPTAKQDYGYGEASIIYGMDQFIGETEYWNRGLGTELVNVLLNHLYRTLHAEAVVLDPQAWNLRAIRCYEKCGFRKVKLLPGHEWHEGSMRDCWLMEWSPSDHNN